MSSLQLDPKKTALVLIDLQGGIVAKQGAPYSTGEVVERARHLAEKFREKGAPVVYVRVNFNNFLQLPADEVMGGRRCGCAATVCFGDCCRGGIQRWRSAGDQEALGSLCAD